MEQNVSDISILRRDRISGQIQVCLEWLSKDLINSFKYFLLMKYQLDDKIIIKLQLNKFEDKIIGLMSNMVFNQKIEWYYKILNGDSGEVFLDFKPDSVEKYNIELFDDIRRTILYYNVQIPIMLGKIMKELGLEGEVDLKF